MEKVRQVSKSRILHAAASNEPPAQRTVWAYINDYEYKAFLAAAVEMQDWPFQVRIFDSSHDVEDFIRQLNDDGSELFLSAWSTPALPSDILARVPTLKYVSHICGAVAFFVPKCAIEQGLIVTNWGHAAGRSVAEHCLMQILSCLRRAVKWQIDLHVEKIWREKLFEAFTLFDKKVGIYGFGASARELVKLLKPFNCGVSAYSQGVPAGDFAAYDVRQAAALADVFRANEVVVCLESLTPETYGTVTEDLLRLIPDGGVFVNTGRGPVVDEAALCRVAAEGRIQIALDVYEKEPLPTDSPLRGLKNVFLTPHIAGPTVDERVVCGRAALLNAVAYFNGAPLENVVDAQKYSRMSKC